MHLGCIMKTAVSIIIPIFNAMPYLEDCLKTVFAQKGADMEVILINNGSTDDSLSLCKLFADRFPNVRVFDIRTVSIGAARNFGLRKAEGDYIMFVDADDMFPDPFVVARMFRKCREEKADICVGNFCRLWGNRLLHATSHRAFSKYPSDSAEFLFTGFFSVDILSYVWAKIYRKSFIEENEISFADSRYAEDKLFNLQCGAAGAVYAFLNREIYVHRNTPRSVSNSYRIHSHLIWLDIAVRLERFVEKLGKADGVWKNVVAYTIFFGCFFDCKMEYRHCNNEIGGVVKLLKEYRRDPLAKKGFSLLTGNENVAMIPSFLYRVLIFGFAMCMKLGFCHLLGLGIKILVDLKIDERLSDTGRKPVPKA